MTDDASRKYLIFQLAGLRFAFDLAQMAEVVEQPVIWPIPLAPGCYTGALNFHGTIVAVMDLARFLDLPAAPCSETVVVVDTRIASLAFLVEKVIRIASVDRTDVRDDSDTSFATARLILPDGDAALFDAVMLAERAGESING